MHEWSLAEQVRNIVLEEAQAHAFSIVRRVTLEVGELSCVDPANLQFAVEKNLEQGIAEGADVQVIPRHGRVRCHHCGQTFETGDLYQTCTYCHRYGFTIIEGKDMLVTGIEGA